MPMAMPFTSRDLDAFPDDGKRYEIIDGELYVSGHPNYYHQLVSGNVAYALWSWIEGDLLDSPLLPGFSCEVCKLFEGIPATSE
jgi:hypothetical protein